MILLTVQHFGHSSQSSGTNSSARGTKKIVLDSGAKTYSPMENEAQTDKTLKPEQPQSAKSLSLFGFFLKSLPEVCPCNSALVSLDLDDQTKRSEYLDFLEAQKQPIRVQENTDQLLEAVIQAEIEKLRSTFLSQKEKSLREIAENRERLIREMVERALNAIRGGVVEIVKDSSSFNGQIQRVETKANLLENLDQTQALQEMTKMKAKSLRFYVQHFALESQVQDEMKQRIWEFFPASKLNDSAKGNFSQNSEALVEGLKLIIENGACQAHEKEDVMYVRFLDMLWVGDKEELFDIYGNKALWIFEDLLNLPLFQNLFAELTKEDLSNQNYMMIYNSLYVVIIKMRLGSAGEALGDETQALVKLLNYINANSFDLFTENPRKQEYLLMKTIIYKRLSQLGTKDPYAKDKVDSKVVVDEGLPLSFYVQRREDRKLLKTVVKLNELDVNLNILKYNIDQLKTQEEFLRDAKDVLFGYLNLGLENASEEDVSEILENLRDLFAKIPGSSERGALLRTYSIRYVYFKYFFNYQYQLETPPKENGIVNFARIPFLRKVLETVFDFLSDNSFERMKAIFSAVQLQAAPLDPVFADLQAFFESSATTVLERVIKPAIENKYRNVELLCAEVLSHFAMFVSPEKQSVYAPLQKACETIDGFHEYASFRMKYFFVTVKWLSLGRIFEGFRSKKHLLRDYVELYTSLTVFCVFGVTLEDTQFHLALEYDLFLNQESSNPALFEEFNQISHKHRFTYYDMLKISNLTNLIMQPKVLQKTVFPFIYFKKMANVLRFFNLAEGENLSFFNRLYSQLRNKPRFYHLNNVYLLLNLQRQQDSQSPTPLLKRLTAEYESVNVFSAEKVPNEHERNQVLASRIAVIYFYTIYLQTCAETKCEGEKHGPNWPKYEDFLQSVLTNEDSRVRLYFFTDYLYENMNSELYRDSFTNRVYSQEEFVNEARVNPEAFPEYVLNRRVLTSWAVDFLGRLDYWNSPARFLENSLYDYFKELLKGRYFDRAEEFKEPMIQNVLAFHRRNGHKLFSDMLRSLLSLLRLNPRIPTQMHSNLVLFNCIAEFVAKMNSPDKKYHNFQESIVRKRLQIFIIQFFKTLGKLSNENLHMPVREQYLNIKMYNLPHIVTLFSVFGLKLQDKFHSEVIIKYMNNTEFIAWAQFALPEHLSAVDEVPEFREGRENYLKHIRSLFKSHELNNLTTQNLEGFFRPLCHFEDALVSSRFIENPEYLSRLESIVPECMEIAKKAGPNEAKVVLFKLLKIFYMPQKYYRESVVIFEDDSLPDWLARAKKLFVRITLTAQELVDFFEFAQMLQKILSSQAKVVNANFQKFFSTLVSGHNLEHLTAHLDSQLKPEGLLNVPAPLMSDESGKEARLRQYYSNTVLYDVLTLMPIDKDTFSPTKQLWTYDFFHLLNQKSSYASFLTNLFQNYSPESPAAFHEFYFLICKFKLVRLLTEKAKQGKLERTSQIDSSQSVSSINKFQEEITRKEAPIFNSFVGRLIKTELAKSKPDLAQVSQLYYLKATNLDINVADMTVFEASENYVVNILQDIRDLLGNSESVQRDVMEPILAQDKDLANNLGFYFQEVSKLQRLIDRYGEIDDKFENTEDQDIRDQYVKYLKDYIELFQNKFGLSVSEDQTIMYQRNLKTLLFKFDAKVVF